MPISSARFLATIHWPWYFILDFPGQDGWGYCVFGEVIAGQDVVDKIEKVETINLGGHADVPGEAIIIKKASISE